MDELWPLAAERFQSIDDALPLTPAHRDFLRSQAGRGRKKSAVAEVIEDNDVVIRLGVPCLGVTRLSVPRLRVPRLGERYAGVRADVAGTAGN